MKRHQEKRLNSKGWMKVSGRWVDPETGEVKTTQQALKIQDERDDPPAVHLPDKWHSLKDD